MWGGGLRFSTPLPSPPASPLPSRPERDPGLPWRLCWLLSMEAAVSVALGLPLLVGLALEAAAAAAAAAAEAAAAEQALSSASLRLVAVSSARSVLTSRPAAWMAPSIRRASCWLPSIMLRILAWGGGGGGGGDKAEGRRGG